MTPLEFFFTVLAASVAAGLLGSLLGLGGGIIIIPTLTLLLKIDIRYAIGASIVSVIATSSGAAAAYVREHMTNLRLAMLLEIATTTGALTGAYVAGLISSHYLNMIFAVILAISAAAMFLKNHEEPGANAPPDRLADRLKLHGAYFDEALGHIVEYRVSRTPLGLALMYLAGLTSGLLGIGSGILKVPALDVAMRLPIKASTATSNLMIGVTAAASAGVYFARGDVDPFVAAPVATGVLVGSVAGARLLGKLHSRVIRLVFVAVLIWVSVEMFRKGLQR